MRRLSFVLALLTAGPAFAADVQVPLQGTLVEADGTPIDGDEQLTFRLYDSDTGTTAVWTSAVTVTFDQGRFTVYLGEADALDSEIFRLDQTLFLSVQVDGDVEMDRFPVGTAPLSAFAHHAGDAETLDGLGSADFKSSDYVPDWTDIQNRPAGLDDGDDVGTIPFGEGLTDTGGSLAVDTDWLDGVIRGTCYDDVDELRAVLDSVYLEKSYLPSWFELTDIPGDLADGDDDTTYDAGTGLLLDQGVFSVDAAVVASLLAGDFLPSSYAPDWTEITNRPAGLDDGDDDTTYAPGAGLALAGDTFSVVDSFVTGLCYDTPEELVAALSGQYLSSGYVPSWLELTDIPPDLLDGDDDTLPEAGFGLAYDTDAPDPTLVVDGSLFLPSDHTTSWNDLADRPADLVDGDDDNLPLAGFGLAYDTDDTDVLGIDDAALGEILSGQFKPSSYTPDWTEITNRPAGLDDGDDDTLPTAGWGLLYDTFDPAPNALAVDAPLLLSEFSESFLPWDYQPAWNELTGVPSDLRDGDDDTTYSPGTGLTLTDTTFSVAPGYVAGICYDTPGELTTALAGQYLPASYTPDWEELTSIPPDIADGDQDTKYTGTSPIQVGGTVISLDFKAVEDGISISWNDLTDRPTDLVDGDDVLSDTDVLDIVGGKDLALGGGTTIGGRTPIFSRYTDSEAVAAVSSVLSSLLGWTVDPNVQFGIAESGCRALHSTSFTDGEEYGGTTRYPNTFGKDPIVAATGDVTAALQAIGYADAGYDIDILGAPGRDRFRFLCRGNVEAVHWMAVQDGTWSLSGGLIQTGTTTLTNGAATVAFDQTMTGTPVVLLSTGVLATTPTSTGFSVSRADGNEVRWIALEPGTYFHGRYAFVANTRTASPGGSVNYGTAFLQEPIVVASLVDPGGLDVADAHIYDVGTTSFRTNVGGGATSYTLGFVAAVEQRR